MADFSVIFVVLALASVACCASIPSRDLFTQIEGRNVGGRIVGGTTATLGQFPYQVALRNALARNICGGWIHSTRWTVTAAHCTNGRALADTFVVVGAQTLLDGVTYAVSDIQIYPQYNSTTYQNDISAVKTTLPILLNPLVQTIPLGSANIGSVTARVSGWGLTSYPGNPSLTLQYLDVTTIGATYCRSFHTPANAADIFDSNICALSPSGEGACIGDSGSPLTYAGYVIGAVSWGVPCGTGVPDVYARISSFRSWLLSVMV